MQGVRFLGYCDCSNCFRARALPSLSTHKLRVRAVFYYMEIFGHKITPFLISVVSVLAATAIMLITTFSCAGNKLNFQASFYFVCYAAEDNVVSAGSISGAVLNYGGAGYILSHGGKYYVTVSCYYTRKDAVTVCTGLKNRGLDCQVLEIQTGDYQFNSPSGKRNAELYTGNFNTLLSLSTLAYECANALDTGSMGQNEAKAVIRDVESGVKGLLSANADNCFTLPLKNVLGECADAANGYVYSKNLRRLQIAAADVIINVKLY